MMSLPEPPSGAGISVHQGLDFSTKLILYNRPCYILTTFAQIDKKLFPMFQGSFNSILSTKRSPTSVDYEVYIGFL